MSKLRIVAAVMVVAGFLLGCPSGDGIPTLSMTAKPTAIDDKGAESTITISATDESGKAGTGTVALTTAAGSLDTTMVTLANGTGTAKFTCAVASDPGCKGSVHISGTWMTPKKAAVTGFTNVQVGSNGGGAGGGGGTDGGTDGGSTGGGTGGGGGGTGGGGGGGGVSGDGGLLVTASKSVIALSVGDNALITASFAAGTMANQAIDFSTDLGLLQDADGGTTGVTFSTTTDSTGKAFARFTESGTSGTAHITALNTPSGSQGSVSIEVVTVQSITFETMTCGMNPCSVMGIKGSGFNESAQVKFKAVDTLNRGVPSLPVTFSATSLPSGTSISPSGVTDQNGEVVCNVASGPVIGSFQVHATVIAGQVETDSNTIGVRGAKPSNKGFGLQCDHVNIAAYDKPSPPLPLTLNCTVQLTDRFANPIGTGTAVNLKVEAGFVPNSTVTNAFPLANEGQGLFTFNTIGGPFPPTDVDPLPAATQPFPGQRFAEPSYMAGGVTHNPRDGLVSLIAYVQGEEWFDDQNQNGVRDANEQFIDQGEPLIDNNDDNVWEAGELYIDSNSNGMWDGPDGIWQATTTVWTVTHILYTDLVDPARVVFTPSSYGACPVGVPKGGSIQIGVYLPDQNLNLLESNTSFAVGHTATAGTVAFPSGTTTLLDGYGFGIQRSLTDVATNGTCVSGTSLICEDRVYFTTWSGGFVGSFIVNGAAATDTGACQNDVATVSVNERMTSVGVSLNGAIQ